MPASIMPAEPSTPVQSMATATISTTNATMVSMVMPTIMTMSFIRQQIDIGIHGIMYQVSQQLADIVKPIMH